MSNYWLDKCKEDEKSIWDFDTTLDDMIKEYKSEYVKVYEVQDVILRRPINFYKSRQPMGWLVDEPEDAHKFETGV